MQSELAFEDELIEYLTGIGGSKQWDYVPEVKTNADLWVNFKHILEQNNQRLKKPLSETEFAQVKQVVNGIKSPYEAGRFIYGLNGITQVEVDLDDGQHVFLTVFDQDQVGAGNTQYQIVNQIERPAILAGRKDRRFDTTLLINGLPIIQIEEKRDGRDGCEALNQMHQYIDEQQYTGIFSTLQILVGMTPHSIRYMANTTTDMFNTAFAFQWQRESDSHNVRDWREFSNLMLSIPMAHQMATSYMILDGTKNKQAVKVMRPYQVYATRKIIDRLHDFQFGLSAKEAGYIWHTTGSGKTISSFKAAWLAARLPNVDKVVFMVDRVALTNQTAESYAAYDPDADDHNKNGVVSDTANINDLNRKLKQTNGIIVTSIQKMDRLTQRDSFKAPNKNIVFIVDEAHRSTAGEMLQRIKVAFPHSAWFGYTGTPSFEGITTEALFGELLHAYTIREAIADRNVLGFKVDFNTTLSEDVLKHEYLPGFYRSRYPQWSDKEIEQKIDHLTPDDMDDAVAPSVYDINPQHVKLVVQDILAKWQNRSADYRYSALFSVHVGGGKASTPRAMEYYREFKARNAELKHPLKIAITFSQSTNNSDNQLDNNRDLREAMQDYNDLFHEHFDDNSVKEYTDNVVSRLNRTIDDDNYLDLVIVIDQLLTGFDAPQLNALYVDRTLKGANLIQAYSRTNRIENMAYKPYGRIVNYRWPAHTEKLMNEALAVYANRDSADVQTTIDELTDDNVIAKDYSTLIEEVSTVVDSLATMTNDFKDIPVSENEQNQMYTTLKKYNGLINQLKQDDQYDNDHPEILLQEIGLNEEQEAILTGSLATDLKEKIAQQRDVSFDDLTLEMAHVNEIKVNYDYLDELIAQLANQLYEQHRHAAQDTYGEINKFADQLDDHKQSEQIKRAAKALLTGDLTAPDYPMQAKDANKMVMEHAQRSKRAEIGDFRKRWGLLDVNQTTFEEMLDRHVKNQDDLDNDGALSIIIREGASAYRDYVDDETISSLSRIKYRNQLRAALQKFADNLAETY